MFWDSDLGKSIETIAYSLYRRPNPELEARVDAIIDMYDGAAGGGRLPQRLVPARAARPALDEPARPPRALLRRPPDRGGGRLLPGHRQAQAARRHVPLRRPHRQLFGRGEGQLRGYCGHEEIELALVKLARVTGERKYSISRSTSSTSAARSRTTSPRRRSATAATRRTSSRRPTNTTSRICRCASRPRSSATRCGPCISIPAWPTSPPSTATTA